MRCRVFSVEAVACLARPQINAVRSALQMHRVPLRVTVAYLKEIPAAHAGGSRVCISPVAWSGLVWPGLACLFVALLHYRATSNPYLETAWGPFVVGFPVAMGGLVWSLLYGTRRFGEAQTLKHRSVSYEPATGLHLSQTSPIQRHAVLLF
jgi:hypothetical protein